MQKKRGHAIGSQVNHRYISSKSTHKLIRKYDNRDGYITRIACSKMIKIIYKRENQHLNKQDIQEYEHTCQTEQDNHGKSRINTLRQTR